MDSGRRTFASADGMISGVRADVHASRVDDLLRPDIDWTIKYLASDQPRSFTISRRLSQTGE